MGPYRFCRSVVIGSGRPLLVSGCNIVFSYLWDVASCSQVTDALPNYVPKDPEHPHWLPDPSEDWVACVCVCSVVYFVVFDVA